MPPSPPRLDDAQIRRYGRQILLDSVGGRGQRALLTGRVRVRLEEEGSDEIRAAALVAIAYLAGSGVGELELRGAFGGPVREADLGILLGREDLTQPLHEAIGRQVAARNPDVRVLLGDSLDGAESVDLVLDEPFAAGDSPDPLLGESSAWRAEAPSARAMWRGARAATRAIAALLQGAA